MRIVFFSPNFLPLTGGLENVMRDWALGLGALGHHVTIVTLTPSQLVDDFPFKVYRNPGVVKIWRLMRSADVVMQFNVSLKSIIPWIASRRPMVVSHQSTNVDVRGRWTRFGFVKQFIANHLVRRNIACSAYVRSFTKNSVVIHNPYNSSLFRRIQTIEREFDLLFVGRLVSDKGCDLLINALSILKKEYQIRPSLTVIGDGPERGALENLVRSEDVVQQVRFAGKLAGEDLVQQINQHRILVVPSTWEEPFGIVALEGLACGCKVIIADSGGLPEA
ncbi:MAG TPA: glycosyltransferase family 4 protein, partial [Cyclobacteriaceae bacterium]|nr:glycosyltransferase family 4 protein [Cyclobacteriaceae bacterium]